MAKYLVRVNRMSSGPDECVMRPAVMEHEIEADESWVVPNDYGLLSGCAVHVGTAIENAIRLDLQAQIDAREESNGGS